MFSWYVLLVGSYGFMTFSCISEETSKYRWESMNEKTQIQNENTKYEIRMKNSWGLLSVAQNLQASNALVRLFNTIYMWTQNVLT